MLWHDSRSTYTLKRVYQHSYGLSHQSKSLLVRREYFAKAEFKGREKGGRGRERGLTDVKGTDVIE